MKRVSRWWAGCLAGLVLIAVGSIPVAAQGTTAGIQGTITDDTGPLPGASIVAKDTGSGFTYEAFADGVGFFALKGLTPGTYEITVAMRSTSPRPRPSSCWSARMSP